MSDKPKLDIVIANTSYIKNRFEDIIEMHLDDVADVYPDVLYAKNNYREEMR